MATGAEQYPYSGAITANSSVNDNYPRYTKRPESWRDMILRLSPAGETPLYVITGKMKKEKPTDPIFHWETASMPNPRATVYGIYTAANLGTSVSTTQAQYATVYIKVTVAEKAHFRVGHQVLLRNSDKMTYDINAKVTDIGSFDATYGYVAVELLQADTAITTPTATSYLRTMASSTVGVMMVCGNINAEGGYSPSPVNYRNQYWENYCQIFRTPLELTGTALETKLKNQNLYQEEKAQKLMQHSMEFELAMLFGYKTKRNNTESGKEERTTQGIVNYLRESASANVSDFRIANAGSQWKAAGKDWLETQLKNVNSYVPGSYASARRYIKMIFTGFGALGGIQKMVENTSNVSYNIQPGMGQFGFNVRKLITPYGEFELIAHPLFNHETTNSYSMLCIDPSQMVYQALRDTFFKPDPNKDKGGGSGYDGLQEEWLTEAGLELHHPLTMGYWTSVGLDG